VIWAYSWACCFAWATSGLTGQPARNPPNTPSVGAFLGALLGALFFFAGVQPWIAVVGPQIRDEPACPALARPFAIVGGRRDVRRGQSRIVRACGSSGSARASPSAFAASGGGSGGIGTTAGQPPHCSLIISASCRAASGSRSAMLSRSGIGIWIGNGGPGGRWSGVGGGGEGGRCRLIGKA
jgi:hypothetical protein